MKLDEIKLILEYLETLAEKIDNTNKISDISSGTAKEECSGKKYIIMRAELRNDVQLGDYRYRVSIQLALLPGEPYEVK